VTILFIAKIKHKKVNHERKNSNWGRKLSNPVVINSLELENVKRVRSVQFELNPTGLTLIGGNNANGKTSILDAIAFLLGGNSKRPSNLQREGSVGDPYLKATLSNGMIVERKGKKSNLTVTDPTGSKSGQTILNDFISELALDLPKFLNAKDKEKAKILLQIIGVGKELDEYENEYDELYAERTIVGRDADQKQKYANELPFYDDLPEAPIQSSELLESHKALLLKNAENEKSRQGLKALESSQLNQARLIEFEKSVQEDLLQKMNESKKKLDFHINEEAKMSQAIAKGKQSVESLQDESTEAIEQQLKDIDATNAKIRSNLDKSNAQGLADRSKAEYKDMGTQLDGIKEKIKGLLDGSDMPLPNLSVEQGTLTYKGQKWDCMSGAEQLIVATSIIRKLKPDCGFVLMDKLEQMDSDTLQKFDAWLKAEGLQNIGTIVGKREECQIIIEDGIIEEDRTIKINTPPVPTGNGWGAEFK